MSQPREVVLDSLLPKKAIALDTLVGVRGEMARLYRLALKGTVQPDEMTKFIYALKEIRACIEAEVLDSVQAKLAALSASVGTHRGR
jgi:hypothetical protein